MHQIVFVLQRLGLTHCEVTGSLASDRMNDVNEFDVCPDRILNTACSQVLMLLSIFTEDSGKTTTAASFTKTFISKNEVLSTHRNDPAAPSRTCAPSWSE